MGGSAQYRYKKKINSLQQKYGDGYSTNPDYLNELDKAKQTFVEQQKREKERSEARKQEQSFPYRGNYEQERLDNAMWTDDKQKVDDIFRKSTGEWWNSLSDEQKKAAYRFTGSGYHDMNGLLGGKIKETDAEYIKAKKLVEDLTTALDSAKTPEDIWVRRGVSTRHINRLFGISNLSTPITDTPDEILQAIADGKMLDVKNFMSTSGANDSGFGGIEMKIFVPKGSKAVYAEPFSTMGLGGSLYWDGISGQSGFSSEFEVLLQRGYKLKPIAFNPEGGRNGTHQIVFTIVGQESKPIS